eukprot:scaffold878_cov271-Pinguiococcus_pyrenoidosus.AAC.33
MDVRCRRLNVRMRSAGRGKTRLSLLIGSRNRSGYPRSTEYLERRIETRILDVGQQGGDERSSRRGLPRGLFHRFDSQRLEVSEYLRLHPNFDERRKEDPRAPPATSVRPTLAPEGSLSRKCRLRAAPLSIARTPATRQPQDGGVGRSAPEHRRGGGVPGALSPLCAGAPWQTAEFPRRLSRQTGIPPQRAAHRGRETQRGRARLGAQPSAELGRLGHRSRRESAQDPLGVRVPHRGNERGADCCGGPLCPQAGGRWNPRGESLASGCSRLGPCEQRCCAAFGRRTSLRERKEDSEKRTQSHKSRSITG